MHEERQVALGEHVEQRGASGESLGVPHGRRGQLEPSEILVEDLGELGRVDVAEAGCGPGAERGGQGEGLLVGRRR